MNYKGCLIMLYTLNSKTTTLYIGVGDFRWLCKRIRDIFCPATLYGKSAQDRAYGTEFIGTVGLWNLSKTYYNWRKKAIGTLNAITFVFK